MDNSPCFSPENTSCRIAGFAFTDEFDCRVCLKYGYMQAIRSLVQRGRATKLTAESLAAKISATSQDETQEQPTRCKYRGKLLQRGSCKCGDGSIWECLHPNMLLPDGSPGRQIGCACGKDKYKGYENTDQRK